MKKIFYVLIPWALVACDSPGSGVAVDLPNAQIDCTSSRCNSKTGAFDAVVTLTKSGCDPSQIDYEDYATGSVSVICGASGCTGTVSSWTNPEDSSAIATIEGGSYDVCGWIDFDSNGLKQSTNDSFSESNQTVNGITLTLSDWSVTYSSRRKIHPHR